MDIPGKIVRNQIDYILVNQRFRDSCIAVRTYPGANIQSDHVPLVGTVKIRMKRIILKSGKRYDQRKLKNPNIREIKLHKCKNQSELNSKLTRISNNTLINVEKEINGSQKVVVKIKKQLLR